MEGRSSTDDLMEFSVRKAAPKRKYARKYTTQRKFRKAVMPRGVSIKSHSFKQVCRPSATNMGLSSGATGSTYDATKGILFGPDPASTAGDAFFAMQFTIGDLPQVSSFAALFDAYKINKIVVKFTPMITGLTTGTGGVSAASTGLFDQPLSTAIDYDDSAVPATLSAVEEYQTYKMTMGYQPHTRIITPAIAMSAYKTSGTTIAYAQKKNVWLDMAYTDVEHYGLKGCIQGTSTAANTRRQAWSLRVVYYFQCKEVR